MDCIQAASTLVTPQTMAVRSLQPRSTAAASCSCLLRSPWLSGTRREQPAKQQLGVKGLGVSAGLPRRRSFALAKLSSGQDSTNSVSRQEKSPATLWQLSSTSTVAGTSAKPPSSSDGSQYPPAVWVGVGMAISFALWRFCIFLDSKKEDIQRAAMNQVLKTMMSQMPPPGGASPFPGAAGGFPGASPFPGGSPFPGASPFSGASPFPGGSSPFPGFPMPPPPTQPSPSRIAGAATAGAVAGATAGATVAAEATEARRKVTSGFTDISENEVAEVSEDVSKGTTKQKERKTFFQDAEVMDDGGSAAGGGGGGGGNLFTIDQLEKMMEDPIVQKMVFPYLPEEMRSPETFKWMMKNPVYRKQMEDMLKNMGSGGLPEWDDRMSQVMSNFNLSSPEVKQQFDAMGMSPEEVIKKIMDNPDIAMAFQNPKIQAALMDCSSNPLNITKYQNDPEIMAVFSRMAEIFPNMSG